VTLILRASKVRAANNIPVPPNFPEIVEDWICRQLPGSHVRGRDLRQGHETIEALSGVRVEKTTQTLLQNWRIAGRKKVPHAEAEARAHICVACPLNLGKGICSACHGLVDWIQQWIRRKPDIVDGLNVCAVTGIMNQAQVHVPVELISIPPSQAKFLPAACWQRKADHGRPEQHPDQRDGSG
jgi:hypothetical protein